MDVSEKKKRINFNIHHYFLGECVYLIIFRPTKHDHLIHFSLFPI
jgi:hypothetical protein